MQSEKPGSEAIKAVSVREVSVMIGEYLGRLNKIWIDGQVVTIRQYGRSSYISFRDPTVEVSLEVVAANEVLARATPPVAEGSRVLLLGSVEWGPKRGDLKIRAHEFRSIGVGDLHAELAARREKLAVEGLFDEGRKRPLPFLPRRVGLITGRDTDAKRDVVVNARRRWPATAFEVREIPLQTAETPLLAIDAMRELERIPDVDVVVIARGGGSMQDLLPWSDEGLVRAVAKSLKPVVSAIGHEADRPLLDEVADVRASTPTDAARRIVPDLDEETAYCNRLTTQLRTKRQRWLEVELRHLGLARQTVAARSPRDLVQGRLIELANQVQRLRDQTKWQLNQRSHQLQASRQQLAALSPFAILARGYSLATTPDGVVVRSPADLPVGSGFQLRLADGEIAARREPDTELKDRTGAAK